MRTLLKLLGLILKKKGAFSKFVCLEIRRSSLYQRGPAYFLSTTSPMANLYVGTHFGYTNESLESTKGRNML